MGKSEREFIRTVKKMRGGIQRTDKERIEVYRRWLKFTKDKYGEEEAVRSHLQRSIEELAELEEVLAHLSSRPRRETLYHLLEEVGDVMNVCTGILALYPMVEHFIGAARDSKLDKLEMNMSPINKDKSNLILEQDQETKKLFMDDYTFWGSEVFNEKDCLEQMAKKMKGCQEAIELKYLLMHDKEDHKE